MLENSMERLFKTIAFRVGNSISYMLKPLEVNQIAKGLFPFNMTEFEEESVNTFTAQAFYNWVFSLYECDEFDKQKKILYLKAFVKEVLNHNEEHQEYFLKYIDDFPIDGYDPLIAVYSGESAVRGKVINENIFDTRKFHDEVINQARELFINGHYRQAILDTYIKLDETIQSKSGIHDLTGEKLINKVFSIEKPILLVSDCEDERRGVFFFFKAATAYVRNIYAHKTAAKPSDIYEALDWLSVASILFRMVENSKKCEEDFL